MTAVVVQADARNLPLADGTVDLVVTSPPYFNLRSYTDDGEHYEEQIGSETTPDSFLDELVVVTRECARVLKPGGSIWVNLGDKYSNRAGGKGWGRDSVHTGRGKTETIRRRVNTSTRPDTSRSIGLPEKTLMGLPWRYALRCIDTTSGVPLKVVRGMLAGVRDGDLTLDEADRLLDAYDTGGRSAGAGLILRAEVIWSLRSPLPPEGQRYGRARRGQGEGQVVEIPAAPRRAALPLCPSVAAMRFAC